MSLKIGVIVALVTMLCMYPTLCLVNQRRLQKGKPKIPAITGLLMTLMASTAVYTGIQWLQTKQAHSPATALKHTTNILDPVIPPPIRHVYNIEEMMSKIDKGAAPF